MVGMTGRERGGNASLGLAGARLGVSMGWDEHVLVGVRLRDAWGWPGSWPSGTEHVATALDRQGAGVAQWLERQPSKLRVAGSNPVSRSIQEFFAEKQKIS